MKRQPFYPTSAAKQVLWLENFRNKLTGYATALGLSNAQRDAAIGDARWLVYVLGSWLPAVRNFSPACTDAAAQAQSGPGTALMVLPGFSAPALPAGVVATNTGALDRIFALIQTIKGSGGYTEAIGTDLGLVGSGQATPDLTTIQPVISAAISGANVGITWGWGGNSQFLDLCEIQVDRGAGWTLLTYDSTPNYTDTAPFPASPAKWKYRAIYRVNDAQTGLWSAEASVIVGG